MRDGVAPALLKLGERHRLEAAKFLEDLKPLISPRVAPPPLPVIVFSLELPDGLVATVEPVPCLGHLLSTARGVGVRGVSAGCALGAGDRDLLDLLFVALSY